MLTLRLCLLAFSPEWRHQFEPFLLWRKKAWFSFQNSLDIFFNLTTIFLKYTNIVKQCVQQSIPEGKHTAHLETVRASVTTTRCGPQMDKFEQVCSDDQQMSLAGGPGLVGVPGLMSRDPTVRSNA